MLVPCVYAKKSGSVEDAVVKVFTTYNSPDYSNPWQTTGQRNTTGSGCVISGERILTSAHVVTDHAFIQVQRSGDPNKYVAKVAAVGHECDLAILTLEDPSFFNDIPPLSVGRLPKLGDKVYAYGFPIGGDKLSITEGVVSRIEMGEYFHSKRRLLTVQIDAAINPGNSGGPVTKDGKIVGLAFQGLWWGENVGYIIPSSIISHFLEDVEDEKFDGFPNLGIVYEKLENSSYRKFLGMSKEQTGILVNQVVYGSSAWQLLKEEDVILEIDGIDVANDGTIPFGKQDRLGCSYYFNNKYIGDTVKLGILRDKEVKEVAVELKEKVELVPRHEYDVKPTYYIFGGLVFMKLNFNYLSIMPYFSEYDPSPASIYLRAFNDMKTPEKEEIVILTSVLADKINFGYHEYVNKIVEKVNDASISGMKDLIGKIESTEGPYLQIGLESREKIVLDVDQCKKMNGEILNRFGIPSDRSNDLKKM